MLVPATVEFPTYVIEFIAARNFYYRKPGESGDNEMISQWKWKETM